jgi:hypothetical protein
MPYGTGSIQMRRRTWWMIYRDPEGRIIQKNTCTEDQNAARRMLAERALETAKARVAALERIIDEQAAQKQAARTADQGQGKTRNGGKHGASGRSVRHHAAVGRDRRTTRGGKC